MDFIGPINLEIIFKIALAFVLGIVVGLEREFAGKEAGPRTYSLVTVGAALFTILSLDPRFIGENSRIISQIIPGIGFIGAGLIIFHESKVRGLATAAGVWSMAAVGIAVGLGYYAVAAFTVFILIVALYFLRSIDFDAKARKLISKIANDKHEDDFE